jgi:hypothetical protein
MPPARGNPRLTLGVDDVQSEIRPKLRKRVKIGVILP